MKFKQFLNESAVSVAAGGTITHLEHLEDYILIYGKKGFDKFKNDVDSILNFFKNKGKLTASVKIDGCIHPNTVIKTEDGDKTIETIITEYNNGKTNKVLTFNEDTNEEQWNIAEYPRINDNDKKWIEIEMDNGEVIKLTEDHEVYIEDKGWIEAKNLQENDDIKEIK